MDLSIPVAVWHAPPSHDASVLAVSKDGKYIVSFDHRSHQGILWHVKTGATSVANQIDCSDASSTLGSVVSPKLGPKAVVPLGLLSSGAGATVAAGFGINENGDAVVATVHSSGTVGFWLAKDGQALAILHKELPHLRLPASCQDLSESWSGGSFHSSNGRVALAVDTKLRIGTVSGFAPHPYIIDFRNATVASLPIAPTSLYAAGAAGTQSLIVGSLPFQREGGEGVDVIQVRAAGVIEFWLWHPAKREASFSHTAIVPTHRIGRDGLDDEELAGHLNPAFEAIAVSASPSGTWISIQTSSGFTLIRVSNILFHMSEACAPGGVVSSIYASTSTPIDASPSPQLPGQLWMDFADLSQDVPCVDPTAIVGMRVCSNITAHPELVTPADSPHLPQVVLWDAHGAAGLCQLVTHTSKPKYSPAASPSSSRTAHLVKSGHVSSRVTARLIAVPVLSPGSSHSPVLYGFCGNTMKAVTEGCNACDVLYQVCGDRITIWDIPFAATVESVSRPDGPSTRVDPVAEVSLAASWLNDSNDIDDRDNVAPSPVSYSAAGSRGHVEHSAIHSVLLIGPADVVPGTCLWGGDDEGIAHALTNTPKFEVEDTSGLPGGRDSSISFTAFAARMKTFADKIASLGAAGGPAGTSLVRESGAPVGPILQIVGLTGGNVRVSVIPRSEGQPVLWLPQKATTGHVYNAASHNNAEISTFQAHGAANPHGITSVVNLGMVPTLTPDGKYATRMWRYMIATGHVNGELRVWMIQASAADPASTAHFYKFELCAQLLARHNSRIGTVVRLTHSELLSGGDNVIYSLKDARLTAVGPEIVEGGLESHMTIDAFSEAHGVAGTLRRSESGVRGVAGTLAGYSGDNLHVYPVNDGQVLGRIRLGVVGSERAVSVYDIVVRRSATVSQTIPVSSVSVYRRHLLSGHHSPVSDVKWDYDRARMAVSCVDGSAYIWHWESGCMERIMDVEDVMAVEPSHTPATIPSDQWLVARPITTSLTVKSTSYPGGSARNSLNTTLHLFDVRVVGAARRLDACLRSAFAVEEVTKPMPSSAPKAVTNASSFPGGGGLDIDDYMAASDEAELATAPMPMAAATHLAYNFLSFLLPWQFEPGLDALVQSVLRLSRPVDVYSFAVPGPKGATTVLFPSACTGMKRWQISTELSAAHALALVALLYPMSKCPLPSLSCVNTTRSLYVLYSRDLTSRLAAGDNQTPSVATLGRWGAGCAVWYAIRSAKPLVSEDLTARARRVLTRVVMGLPRDQVVSLAYEWAARFVSLAEQVNAAAVLAAAAGNPRKDPSQQELALDADLRTAVLILSVIAIVSPADVSRDIAVRLVNVLLQMMDTPSGLLLASGLLGRGFALWTPHMTANSTTLLIRRLLEVAYAGESFAARAEANAALLKIGVAATQTLIAFLLSELSRATVTSSVRKAALTVLAQLSAKNPTAVIPSLESLIACLLKALDPRDTNRTQALKEVSATLRVVLKHFPMTAYHKGTNRLAVGYVDHSIVLYDLTTTSKLRVFKGHEGRPSCLCFNSEGDHLASYSAQESNARVWAVGGTGVISGLLRSQGKCVNQFALPKIAAPAVEGSLASFMRSGKADTGGVDTLSCAMLWNLPGVLRLKREDGSNVTLSVQM